MVFQNMRKGPIIGTDLQRRSDREIVNIGCETRFCEPGQIQDFDEKNPAIQIYVRAGYLAPADAEAKAWAKKV